MMEEEEYQQEGEFGEAGMDEGSSSSGTPIAALEVRTPSPARHASLLVLTVRQCCVAHRDRTASRRPM